MLALALVAALSPAGFGTPAGAVATTAPVAGQPVPFGSAGDFGSVAGKTLSAPVVGMASTPSGRGYWLVASDGGIFAFGDAAFFGSTGALRLNRPIVGMASTPSGRGYWLAASDGGIFTFGDAAFHGSAGALPLVKPVVGMSSTPSGRGYWLAASDGGIFAFGDATFFGSTGALRLNRPIVGMAATPSGRGYWLAASDGGIFTFGDAPFYGSLGDAPQGDPIGAVVATPDGLGMWLLPVASRPPPPVTGALGTIFNLSDLPGNVYPRGTKVAALTFDDGPNPAYTPQILAILARFRVPATFAVVGFAGAAHPNLLAQESGAGMGIANHTWDHKDLTKVGPTDFAGEIDRTTATITSATGRSVKCVRPPYGATDPSVKAELAQRGLGQLLWDVDPTDYNRPGSSVIVQRVLGALHPGAIILMHDGGGDRSETVAALPAIIRGIQAAGYTIAPVCN